jgi:hypothetical protein
MSIEGDVDAGVNLGPLHIHGMAELDAGVNSIVEQLKALRNIEEAYQFGAVQVKLAGTASSNSLGATIEISLGGPAYGRLWQVRSLVVGGSLWTSTVAGEALVVLSPAKNLTPALTDIVDQAASLPLPALYGTGQIVVRHPNHLRVVILTPTVSTQYAAGGYATDMPDKRERIEVDR